MSKDIAVLEDEDEDDDCGGGDDDGGGDAGLNSNVDGGDCGVDKLNPNDVDGSGGGIVVDDDGDCIGRNDGGGGGGDIGAAVAAAAVGAAAVGAAVAAAAVAAAAAAAAGRRFLLSTNRRSLSANGGMIRLRAAVAVATFALSNISLSSSLSLLYASRSCTRPLCIYRQDNKRHTCLITVSNIVLTCISTGYGRSDRVCHIETPLHFPKPLLQRYDNPTQDVHDKTGRRYVILIFR